MTTTIRMALPADAERLSRLGAATFRETFAEANTPDDMARYLAETFTPERQAAEIDDPAGIVLLAEQHAPGDDVALVGYAHLVRGPAPAAVQDAVQGTAPMELKRLYVARAWHGRGVAQALMDDVLGIARARGADTLWLGVWERNPRAVAFYAKYGFARVGEHTFVLGSDAQTDWLLARPLAPPRLDDAPSDDPDDDADDDEEFSLADTDVEIPCPACGNELVHDGRSLTLAESPRGGMFECGACGEISQWAITLVPRSVRQVPITWGESL